MRIYGAQDGASTPEPPERPRGVREADGPLHLAAASCEVFYLPEESCQESFGGGLTTRTCLLRRGRRIASHIPPGGLVESIGVDDMMQNHTSIQ